MFPTGIRSPSAAGCRRGYSSGEVCPPSAILGGKLPLSAANLAYSDAHERTDGVIESPANRRDSGSARARIAPRRSPVRVRLAPSKIPANRHLNDWERVVAFPLFTDSQEAALLSVCGGAPCETDDLSCGGGPFGPVEKTAPFVDELAPMSRIFARGGLFQLRQGMGAGAAATMFRSLGRGGSAWTAGPLLGSRWGVSAGGVSRPGRPRGQRHDARRGSAAPRRRRGWRRGSA
jgi:hypothetical protein